MHDLLCLAIYLLQILILDLNEHEHKIQTLKQFVCC